ncbi:MAG: MFS transporter [Treponema sp.]|jgi:GPH family glycoside/pentoside/hexuronide:cation symporter|nr:MFS transporter [Treponema sp.]
MSGKKQITRPIRWLWALGDAGFAAVVMISLNYFPPFLTDYAKFSLPMVAIILGFCNGIDTIMAPFVGIFIEKIKMPWGKFRSWLLVGGLIVFVFNILQYTRFSHNEVLSAIIIIVGAGVGRTMWNVTFTADTGMIPILADASSDYNHLMARRQMWQYVGRLSFSISGVPLIALFTGLISPYWAIFIVAVIFSLLMVIGWWIEFGISGGYEESVPQPANRMGTTTWVDMAKVLKNGPLWVLIVGATLRDIGMFTFIGFAFYYFRYVWNNLPAFGHYMIVSSIMSTVVTMFIAKHLISKLGPKKMWIVSASIASVLFVFLRIFARNAYWFIVTDAFNAFTWASAMAVHPMLFTDVATYAEWKTGIEARGFILGLGNINTKVAVFVSGLVLSGVLMLIKFVPDAEQSAASISALHSAFCLIPPAFYILHILVMTFAYRLDGGTIEKMKAEIEARRAAQLA